MEKGFQIILCMIFCYVLTEIEVEAKCHVRCRLNNKAQPCPEHFTCKTDRKGIPRCYREETRGQAAKESDEELKVQQTTGLGIQDKILKEKFTVPGCYTAFNTTECRHPNKEYASYYHEYQGTGSYYDLEIPNDYDYRNVFVKGGVAKDGATNCFCDPKCVQWKDCCYDSDCLNK